MFVCTVLCLTHVQYQTFKLFKLCILSFYNKHFFEIWFSMRKGGNRIEGTVIFKKLFILDCTVPSWWCMDLLQLQRAGLSVVVMHWLLMAMASRCRAQAVGTRALVVAADGLSSCGLWALEHTLGSCGTGAWLLCSMWDLTQPGIEPVSPALAGGFLSTVPPGKSHIINIYDFCNTGGKTQQQSLSTHLLCCNHKFDWLLLDVAESI